MLQKGHIDIDTIWNAAAPDLSPGYSDTLDHPIAQVAQCWVTPFADQPAAFQSLDEEMLEKLDQPINS